MTTPPGEPKRRSIRSFVIRAGRMTKGQEKGMNEFKSVFGLTPADGPAAFREATANATRIVAEIGFGMGDTLIEQVKKHPDTQFIGIEVHPPGVGHVLNELGKQQLSNCHVYHHCAKEVLEAAVPPASLDKIQVFFPDPWHKKRHHKRRLIQTDMVALMAKAVAPGGFCHLATDWAPYAEHMQAVFAHSPDWQASDLETMLAHCPVAREETRFERRGVALGHAITDLIYQRVEET